MLITFLGTGTSGGIPVLTCHCEVCRSLDYRDKRLRVSVWLQIDGKSIVIDSGPDFRQQALREGIKQLDAVVFTHEHKDHTGGLDDVRPYNYLQGIKHLSIYGHQRVLKQLQNEYYYAFAENKYPGVPLLQCHEIEQKPFEVENITFTPIAVMHHKLPVLGFRIGDFSYITDANHIADEELEKLKGSKVLVLNALQHSHHISHFNLQEAIQIVEKVQPEKAYFTHISHKLGLHADVQKDLPENIFLAYDGLKIRL